MPFTLQRFTLITYVATVFLSALLLFSVQPMLTKMVLPKLGGSPAVWAVSMCFFQGALLLGYCCAFGLNRLGGGLRSVVPHTILLAGACLALPVALPAAATVLSEGGTYLWLISVLTAAVGLPFLALSANAPLLQSWFAQTGHPDAHDPYFLYSASNVGSLVALLSYPIAVEPMLALRAQSTAWSVGFVLLALMVVLSGVLMLVGSQPPAPAIQRTSSTSRVHWPERLAWVGLAFVPSGLLVAFTTFLTTDIASAPFLWVVPLALFLATFIVAFRPSMPWPERWLEVAQPVAAVVALASLSWLERPSLAIDSAIGLVAFVTTCLVCHRRLYRSRPAAAQLTEFYLWMSLGGVLGGVFSAIVAPQIFSTAIEYPLLLALGLGWRLGEFKSPLRRYELIAIAAALLAAAALGVALGKGWAGNAEAWPLATRLLIFVGLAIAMLAATSRLKLQVAIVALVLLFAVAAPRGYGTDYSARSFFGVHRVREAGAFRILYHGTTIHGAQRLRAPTGQPINPSEPPEPVTYYRPTSPLVVGLALARAGGEQHAATVGIIGLGVGTMACHARPEEKWRFFEIDPVVVDIARNPRLFNYLSSCKPDADVVMGDARVTLARQEPRSFDYLLVDAFSSDAIPVHLLTVGALELYLSKLSERGVLVLHISNRHLDLLSVVGANVAAVPGLRALYVASKGGTLDSLEAHAVIMARYPDILAPLRAMTGAAPLVSFGITPWTDDYSDVASAMVRAYQNSRKSVEDREILYFSAAIGSLPDDELGYKGRADANMRKGNYGAVIDDLTTAIRLSAGDLKAHKTRGMAYQFAGDDSAAVSDLTLYLSQNQNDLTALEVRGIAYGNLGERERAIADFRRVLFLNPANERSRQFLDRLNARR